MTWSEGKRLLIAGRLLIRRVLYRRDYCIYLTNVLYDLVGRL